MSTIQPFQRRVCVPVPIVGSERSSQVDDETVPLVGQVVHFGEEVESFRGEREVERGRERGRERVQSMDVHKCAKRRCN